MQVKMFKTPTCGRCPNQIEILEELDSKGVIEFDAEANVIDATENMDEANRYAVRSFPTTVLLEDAGDVVQRFTGVTPAEKIEAKL
jgi:thiol-disulfide isomerase/thioredoxin